MKWKILNDLNLIFFTNYELCACVNDKHAHYCTKMHCVASKSRNISKCKTHSIESVFKKRMRLFMGATPKDGTQCVNGTVYALHIPVWHGLYMFSNKCI